MSKNILFVGPYRQSDGWGEAAKAYIMALRETGHYIATRPIYMSNNISKTIQPEIEELESRRYDKYDIIIQKVLPNFLEFSNDSDVKNINLCVFETGNIQHTRWTRYINMIDELWVPSSQESMDVIDSGVKVPVQIINEPIDTEKFKHTYDDSRWSKFGWHDKFMFYFIGEYIPRKNLNALITAFHREFGHSEDVGLVIKANKGGLNPDQLTNLLNKDIVNHKNNLMLYQNIDRYIQEWVIADYLSNEQLCSLHQICDCFVMPSRGEACCRPMLDAVGFGNPVIITDNTGMTSYVDNKVGWVVPSRREPVCSSERPLPYLYTGHELWSEIDVLELQKSMRQAFEMNGLKKAQMKSQCKSHIEQFSYKNVAKRIEEIL